LREANDGGNAAGYDGNGNNQYNNGGGQYGGQNGGQYGGQYGGNAAAYGEYNNGEMNEESLYFLRDYSITLLSCIEGEQVINYENGEMQSSSVIFRLCPSSSCDSSASEMGCEDGYGDYVVGINTFLKIYLESQQENQGGNNYYQNSMIAYNQYGQQFDAGEYMECSEYNVEEAQEEAEQQQDNNNYGYNYYNNQGGQGGNYNYQQYNNQQYNYNNNYYQNVKFYIGPGCSADGTTITLNMYMDKWCSYPAQVSFADVSRGWENGLPFSEGGLISMDCIRCYRQNEDYNYELNDLCLQNYASSSSRCEADMESYSYYGHNTNGCDYIDSFLSTVYSNVGNDDVVENSSTEDSTWKTTATDVSTRFMDTLSTREARAFIALMVLFSLSACFGALLITCLCVKKRKERKKAKEVFRSVPEAEPMKKQRSSVIALVRSGTNNLKESLKSVTAGTNKSSSTKKSNKRGTDTTECEYKDMEDPIIIPAGVEKEGKPDKSENCSTKTNKSVKNKVTSAAKKTVASITKSLKKKGDDTTSAKSEYKAPKLNSAPKESTASSRGSNPHPPDLLDWMFGCGQDAPTSTTTALPTPEVSAEPPKNEQTKVEGAAEPVISDKTAQVESVAAGAAATSVATRKKAPAQASTQKQPVEEKSIQSWFGCGEDSSGDAPVATTLPAEPQILTTEPVKADEVAVKSTETTEQAKTNPEIVATKESAKEPAAKDNKESPVKSEENTTKGEKNFLSKMDKHLEKKFPDIDNCSSF